MYFSHPSICITTFDVHLTCILSSRVLTIPQADLNQDEKTSLSHDELERLNMAGFNEGENGGINHSEVSLFC